MAHITNTLKHLRTTQPFNYLATGAVKTFFALTGQRSEFIIKHLHRVGPVQGALPNGHKLRLWSRGDDWVSNQVYWRGWDGYEPETVPLFFRLAQQSKTTLDVGSYVGYFTLLAAHANPEGRVYAFEPMPQVFKRLQRHVSLNRLHNVECLQSAVGAEEGTAEFFHMAVDLPTSSSLSYEFMEDTPHLQRSPVPVTTIDRFIRDKKLEHLDLVKIDTESTEPNVLRGMAETLRRDHPMMICEVLPKRGSEKPLQEILEPLGYSFYLLTPEGPVLKEEIEGHPEWLNYLFTTLDEDAVSRL